MSGPVETAIARKLSVAFTPEQLAAAGVDPGMLRVALGVEDPEDLIADVEQALASA